MDKLTNEQREQALRRFEITQNKKMFIGKIMVIFIASANIVLWILSAIANSAITALVVQLLTAISKIGTFISQLVFPHIFMSEIICSIYFLDTAGLNILVIGCTLIIQILLSNALISGVTWSRYFLAVVAVLNALATFYTLLVVAAEIALPAWSIIVLLINLAYCIVSSILLFGSDFISEYMYAKKN